jgi:aminoglycoside phosphotransferase (APT) family kinase protein
MNQILDLNKAFEAWQILEPNASVPTKIKILKAIEGKKHSKSSVYKLEGLKNGKIDIVAKNCSRETAELESAIYRELLPNIPVNTLNFYGHVEFINTHWLFMEYADGECWDPGNPTHVYHAAKWLADLHFFTSKIDERISIPEKDSNYYLFQIEKIVTRAKESISNTDISANEKALLEQILIYLQGLRSIWRNSVSYSGSIGSCLVHNDFVGKNIKVRRNNDGYELLPFDWEMSCIGIPASDLYWMTMSGHQKAIKLYWERYSNYVERVAISDIEQLAKLGAIYRNIDALEWASYGYVHKSNDYRNNNILCSIEYLKSLKSIVENI